MTGIVLLKQLAQVVQSAHAQVAQAEYAASAAQAKAQVHAVRQAEASDVARNLHYKAQAMGQAQADIKAQMFNLQQQVLPWHVSELITA
jgi:hypothetical protein